MKIDEFFEEEGGGIYCFLTAAVVFEVELRRICITFFFWEREREKEKEKS